MRGKGINYDTGFSPGGHNSREHFDAGVVRAEMRVIARELHCTAVRISGGDPGRLSTAGELAAAEGLEVWFAPFPCELTIDQLAPLFAAEGVDLAFWFTFAGYGLVHDPDPRRDLDMASYGVVKMLPGGPDGSGTGYRGLGWEPKLSFAALAQADWRAAPVRGGDSMPSAPASQTAATSSGQLAFPIGAWTIGTSMPSSWQRRVMGKPPPW